MGELYYPKRAKHSVQRLAKELRVLALEQEFRAYVSFTRLRRQYHKYHRWNMDMDLLYDLSHYWFLLQPFSNRAELELLHNKLHVYEGKEKNEVKLWMEIPDIDHSQCDDYNENAAFLAWSIYRGFFINKVHSNIEEFFKDVQFHLEAILWPKQLQLTTTYEELGDKKPYYVRSYYYPKLYDKEPYATANCLLRYLEEDYPFFQAFFSSFKERSSAPLDEETQLRLLNFWLHLLPFNMKMLSSLEQVEVSKNYFFDIFSLIETHWQYIKTLKKDRLTHYYLHTVFYRRNVPGLSSFTLEVLPETRRRFQEFVLEQRQLLQS